MNSITLVGTLFEDPIIEYYDSGALSAKLGIFLMPATPYPSVHSDKDVDQPLYIEILLWGKNANLAYNSTKQGTQVFITGRLIGPAEVLGDTISIIHPNSNSLQ